LLRLPLSVFFQKQQQKHALTLNTIISNHNFVKPNKQELIPLSGQQPNKLMRDNNLQEDHFLEEEQESPRSSTG